MPPPSPTAAAPSPAHGAAPVLDVGRMGVARASPETARRPNPRRLVARRLQAAVVKGQHLGPAPLEEQLAVIGAATASPQHGERAVWSSIVSNGRKGQSWPWRSSSWAGRRRASVPERSRAVLATLQYMFSTGPETTGGPYTRRWRRPASQPAYRELTMRFTLGRRSFGCCGRERLAARRRHSRTGAIQRARDQGRAASGRIGFQPAATELARDIHWLDGLIIVIIIAISVFVLALLAYVILRFNRQANPKPARFTHNPPLEVAWTVVPDRHPRLHRRVFAAASSSSRWNPAGRRHDQGDRLPVVLELRVCRRRHSTLTAIMLSGRNLARDTAIQPDDLPPRHRHRRGRARGQERGDPGDRCGRDPCWADARPSA